MLHLHLATVIPKRVQCETIRKPMIVHSVTFDVDTPVELCCEQKYLYLHPCGMLLL